MKVLSCFLYIYFSSTTSNVCLKLWKSSKDPWWRTYGSISFCLTNLRGKSEATIYVQTFCVIYLVEIVYVLAFDLFGKTAANFYKVQTGIVRFSGLFQGLRRHCFLCQQSL